LVALHLSILRPYYQVNDDIFKIFFAKGIGTDLSPTEFLGYSSPLLGHALKVLFALCPGFAWYGALLLTVQLLGLWALLYAAWSTSHRAFKASLFLAAFLCFYVNLFASLQFTVTSSLAAQGAFLLGAALWREGRRDRGGWALVGGLCVLSFLIRADAFLLTLLAALPLLLAAGASRPLPWREVWKEHRSHLLTLGSILLFISLFGSLWYRSDPAWREFQAFDRERVEMQDYRIHTYDERTRPFFEKVGWTRNDYEMFKDWYFLDPSLYNLDTLRELKRNFPSAGLAEKPSSYKDFRDLLRDHWVWTALALALTFILLSPVATRGRLLFQVAWVLALLAALLYFLRLPDRVAWPLMALPLGAALITAETPAGPSRKGLDPWTSMIGAFFLLLVLVLGLRSLVPYHRSNTQLRGMETVLKADVVRLSPREDQLFVVWDSSFPFEGYGVLDDLEGFRGFRLFTLAVYQRTPNARKMLEKFHVRDLLKDLVDRPDLFLICTPQEGAMYQRHMMEKHGSKVYAERYFEGRFFRVYRIHSRPPWAGKKGA